MAEQATQTPSRKPTAPEVTEHGILRQIRYMVNSTPEFIEIMHTVNQMFNKLENPEENKRHQEICRINVTPLPHSESKFIVSFMVPCELLGAASNRRTQKVDYADFHKPDNKPQIIKKPPKMLFCFEVDNLFDLNMAFYSFEATLAPAIPTAQWSRIRRSIKVIPQARNSPQDKLRLVIVADTNAAVNA